MLDNKRVRLALAFGCWTKVDVSPALAAEAGHSEVVVTRTVRDLATGTDLAFSPVGAVGLRGIPGEWDLFAASA